ncbi:uncharacterized protein LOC126748227 [Anthonomus grandis grandis]|uniref:uncharacterized protein LOC126748227 n=1 Tax=Anthonomus grandis grandis TaxID=2921223 RepID=UPI0021668258|nr:uncharacterized protein LOC126748227 [Anthonomus grandis grandis]
MSSSEDEDVLALVHLNNIKRRRYWVHPLWKKKNKKYGSFNVFKELNQYPERFQSFYRMSKDCFTRLLNIIKPKITKKNTNWRNCVSAEERLLITLRYFATGSSFKSLQFYFLRGHTTIRKIVYHTAKMLWKTLQPQFLPKPTSEKWLDIAERFYSLWNLPNCIGSIDGKHIRIKAPPNSGSAFHNYKGFFSIVLLAVVDADGLIISVDVGEYGRNSDGRALKESKFGKCLVRGELNIPDPTPLPGEDVNIGFPYYFVGDEAFPLRSDLMKPFARNQLTNERRMYNYRISRGRKSVECCFGMLSTKFGILQTPICMKTKRIDIIILAICALHNFILDKKIRKSSEIKTNYSKS